jgi:amidase
MARDVAGIITGMQLLEPSFSVGTPGRIGRYRPAAAAGVEDALDRVLGNRPTVELPGWEEADTAGLVLLDAEAFALDRHLLATGRVGPDVAKRLAQAGEHSAATIAHAAVVKQKWLAEVLAALEDVDVIALPVLRDAPAPLDDPRRMSALRLTVPVNLAGLPAVAMPVPRRDGPPASLQLIGRAGSEEMLLATALELEAALP